MHKRALNDGVPLYTHNDFNPDHDEDIGMSRISGKKSLVQTIISRFAMSFACVSMPTMLVLGLRLTGIRPGTIIGKYILELCSIGACLSFAYPISAAIFPPISKIKVKKLEKTFTNYYSKDTERELYF